MPLTSKGRKIRTSMIQHYRSKKKGTQVFYASANAGRIKGVHRKKR